MIRNTCLIVTIILGLTLQPSIAQQPVSVVVLPFEVFAEKDLSYLQTEIPSALKKSLEQAGARVLLLDSLSEPQWKMRVSSPSEIKKLALQTGAEYMIWGSLTWIGQQFSLDLKLFESLAAKPPKLFSAVGKGVENLPASLESLALDLSLIIFKRQKILEINVEGNQRIEADAIKKGCQIETRQHI